MQKQSTQGKHGSGDPNASGKTARPVNVAQQSCAVAKQEDFNAGQLPSTPKRVSGG